MSNERVREIKHAQRESVILRELSNLFLRVQLDDSRLQGLYITKVKLSPDRGMSTIYLHSLEGLEAFEKQRPILVLYKSSLRHALSQLLQARYTPDLLFKYDEQYDKQRKIDELIDKLKDEGKL
jgi:ribosome-binding factor A